ncbi:UbiA family prenyltransferase [bacterium]|nr:UbiA family prenyltransferase [bacterium]
MNEPAAPTPTWLEWLRLARVSALPSALSNILMGYLLINSAWQPRTSLWLLLLASACLYSAGMILNDFFDRKVDLENSPNRPIPSGRISAGSALFVGLLLLGTGIALAGIAGATTSSGFSKPLIISSILALTILLYDWVLKKTFIAPLLMGLCRTLNVLLGASVFGDEIIVHGAAPALGFNTLILWVAGSIGIYVTGLTVFARDEHRISLRWKLILGLLIMCVGFAGLALIPEQVERLSQINRVHLAGMFNILILLVAIIIVRSAGFAIWTTSPTHIQSTVITSLRSLIIFDACIVFLFRLGEISYPLTVISLLGVSLIIGLRIRPT